jgi:hypothetical protein
MLMQVKPVPLPPLLRPSVQLPSPDTDYALVQPVPGGRAASDHTQRSMARQEATDFIRGAAVERRQRARETEIDQLLRRMRTEAFAPVRVNPLLFP